MAQAKEERAVSVTLPHYPNDDYLWAPNPFGERRQKLFREFNHLPEDIEIYIQKAN